MNIANGTGFSWIEALKEVRCMVAHEETWPTLAPNRKMPSKVEVAMKQKK